MGKLPQKLRESIQEKMLVVAQNPYAPNNNIKALNGGEGYRLRVGDYRIVYHMQDGLLLIEVVRVKHRSEVYQ